ncbi:MULTISPECIES: MoaD/ThiS family protein [unclassified Pseudactinotalea]|uniref:MoaD/ThiS family protein n=1 Tax=unclassified Pseudactinotalea TaxID=2649176 RepID=UPI003C7E3595
MSVRVRLFAVAAEMIGRTEVQSAAGTVGDLLRDLTAHGGPGTGDVLDRCSILVNGRRSSSAQDPVPAGATVDVLPPFAGG